MESGMELNIHLLHVKMYKSLKRALYESGMYTERMVLGKKCAVLPEIDIFLKKT